MIPAKTRKALTEFLELYPKDSPLVMSDRCPDGQFYALGSDEDGYTLHGSTRIINWARDIRNTVFVPETYSDEASTWA